MQTRSRAVRWTYAEFARLPSEGGARHEIIADELVMTPAPGRRHQRVSMLLGARLHAFVERHGLGQVYHAPFDVLFAEGDFVQPDLLFIRADRLAILSDRGVEGAPDLIVEIASPSTAARDRSVKLERYRYYGVPEYWIVDPDTRVIEVWRLAEGAMAPEAFGAEAILRWRPGPSDATLELEVGEVVPARD